MTWERCEGSKGYGFKDSHSHDGAKDRICAACREIVQKSETKTPPSERRWLLFALERDGRFDHFYPSTVQLTMCGSGPMALVRLVLDPDGPYWGWYHSHHPYNGDRRGEVSMIYPNRACVEICFPHGPDVETAHGHGEIVRLRAERIRDAVHPDHIRDGAE